MVSMTVPTIIGGPLIGRISARIGPRRPTLVAVGCVLFGTAFLALTTGGWIGLTAIGLAFVGVGGGGVAAVTGIAMTSISEDRAGMASGILSVQRALGSTVGFAIMGSILAAVVSLTLSSDLEPLISDDATRAEVVETISDDANPRAMATLIGPGRPLPDEVREDDELYAAADASFTDGIRAAEALAFLLVLGAFVHGFRTFPRTESSAAADEEGEALADGEAAAAEEGGG